jgi:hypothetical protein
MTTIEERLAAYSIQLDAAADHADANRHAPQVERAMSAARSGMRGWQSVSVAAVTIALLGAGLWAIADRDPSDPSVAPSVSGTAVAGSAAPWYRITDGRLTAQPVERETCCTTFDVPGPPTVVSWQAAGGPDDGLLVLTAYPPEEAGGAGSAADATLLTQPDGSVWQFWSYGMTSQQREALAAKVVPGSGLPFVLPDDSMTLLSIGGLGAAAHTRTQTYVDSDTNVATISVGSDRGLFRVLALSESLTDTTVAGMPAFRSEQSDGTLVFDWRATADRWATLVVGAGLADQADAIASTVVPDQSELLPPGMAAASNGPTTESDALAHEAATTLSALGWQVTLEEHESRTTAEGVDVSWAYFSESGRRLMIVLGPANLIATVPDLQRHLTSNQDPTDDEIVSIWPQETWLTTAALATSDRTIIVRSEGIDPTGSSRSSADIESFLRAASAEW